MRFVQFCNKSGVQRLGVQLKLGGDIIDINAADTSLPNSLINLLNGGKQLLDRVKTIANEGKHRVSLNDVKLLAPVQNPDKIACVGLNYRGHCEEQKLPLPKEPMVFSKFSSCIVGPYDDIKYPTVSDQVDWEVELAVVIGKKGYNIPESQSLDHVFGYTIAQDISARDWQKQRNGGQFLLGKAMDTFCPLGPAIVTKEAINNIYDLKISTKVNGELKQSGNTGELIHKIESIIARISSCVTLMPGDVILTGTPAGVGMHRSPPEFLKPGDVVTSEIDQIGVIENKVVKN